MWKDYKNSCEGIIASNNWMQTRLIEAYKLLDYMMRNRRIENEDDEEDGVPWISLCSSSSHIRDYMIIHELVYLLQKYCTVTVPCSF